MAVGLFLLETATGLHLGGRVGYLFVVGIRERFRGRRIAESRTDRLYGHCETLGWNSAWCCDSDGENIASRGVTESLGGTGKIGMHCFRKRL